MERRTKDIGQVIARDSTLGPRQIRVIASTETPDRVGDIVVLSGLDLKNYRRNPIVLLNHCPDDPIGTAVAEVKSGRLEALITFAPEGASEEADEAYALAKAGVLRSASIAFAIKASSPIKGGGLKITEAELYEISLVSIPANPDAVVIQRSVFGRTVSAKTSARERRNAAVSALKRGAPSAAERAATLARLKAKGVTPPSGDPAQYASDRVAEMEADARLRSNLAYRKNLTHAQRLEELERLRR